MKIRLFTIGLILSLLLGACGAEQPPTLSSADVGATAQSVAFTMVAQTQQALPTETPVPPTDTPTATPHPTDTQTSTPTIDPLLPTASFTPDPNASTSQGNCDKVLTEWQVPTIKILVENETQPKGTIILGLYVETSLGECGYIPVYGNSASGPAGYYSAYAWVTGKKNFTVSGGFLMNGGSWTIVVRNDQIVAKGGCYPNC